MAKNEAPNSYKDPFWSDLSADVEKKLELPTGLLKAVLLKGERSNADQVSEAGAKTPFQIIPETRKAVLNKYGLDAYLSPENAAEAAGLLLKESLQRNKGDVKLAVAEYHGGTDPKNWGQRTKSYIERVSSGLGESQPRQSTFQRTMQAQGGIPEGSIQNIYSAYSSGQMSPEESADFEADVKAGKIMLPSNAQLKSADGSIKTGVEPMLLPQEVTNAYVNNQMSDKERADLEADMRAGLVKLPPSIASRVPSDIGAPMPTEQGIIQREPEPTLGQKIVGVGETALALGTGATTGTLGMVGGAVKGIAEQILTGEFGTQDAVRLAEESAMRGAQLGTYSPRTPTGQEYTQQTAKLLSETIPPVIPVVTAPGAILQATSQAIKPLSIAAKAGAATTTQAAKRAGQAITEPIQAGIEAVRETISGQPLTTKTAGASVGAAATPKAIERVTTAEGLPVPITMTRGASTRDSAQLAFEKEQMKSPSLGQPLRDRAEENNVQALQNFDVLIDRTDAQTPDLSATGSAVTKALSDGYKKAKTETRIAYKNARNSPESESKINTNQKVIIGEGEMQIDGSLVDYLNSKVIGVPSSAVTDAARKILIKQGLALDDGNGNLIGVPGTVGKLEDFRREISGIAKFDDATGVRDEIILKKIVDAITEPVSGPLYKKARALRTEQARKYENRAVVARLIRNRKGMDDPQVAVDQVFQRTILGGSPEEITFIKRVLNTSGPDGQQAWKELQGATLKHLKDESTKGMGMGANDQPIVSPAKLNQTIQQLDKNGRLDIIFGKKTAQTLRDLNDVLKYINTVPPGTLVNPSGTAGTILAALTEAGATGAMTGIPVPALSAIRFVIKLRKEKATKAKINDALNALPEIPVQP